MRSKVESQKLRVESQRSKLWLCTVWLLLLTFNFRLSTGFPQQPQAQAGQPIYPINAKYVQGFGPGYWPTAGSQLTLNLAPGTAICGNTVQTYTGGTLTLTASTTNYVYLDASNNCTPASNTTGFSSTSIPIAQVTTDATAISSITDVRTMFVANESGSVTSVGMTGDSVIFNATVQGSPITASGTLIPQLLTQAANTLLAGPSAGAATAPTFRALVGADLPTPSASALGGVKSVTCGSGQFVNEISTSGTGACATPSGGGGSPTGLGNGITVIDATTTTGGDAEAQIAAALAALPSTGGTIDGRGFNGDQTWGTTFVVTKPLKLLLGNATFTFSGPGPMILVKGVTADIIGTSGTQLVTSSNDDAIRSTADINSGDLIVNNLSIQDALGSDRTKGAGVNVDFGDQRTSTRFDCLDVYVHGFMFGFREVLPINSHFIGCEALSAQLDDFRIEGGTSTSFISTFANSSNRDGYALTSRYAPSQLLDPQPVTLTVNSPGTGTLPAGTYPLACSALDGNGGETDAMWQLPVSSATITLGQTVTITCQPVYYNQWQPSTTYAPNQIVVPNPDNGRRYISITSGTAVSGSSQPSFCASTQCTVTDGGLTWQENGTSNVAYNIYMPGYDSVSQAYDVLPFRLIATTSPGTNFYTVSAPPTFQQSGGKPVYQPQTNTTGVELAYGGGLGYSSLISTAADSTQHTAYSLVKCYNLNLVGAGAEANNGLGIYLYGSNQINLDTPFTSAHEGGIWIDVPNPANTTANNIKIVNPNLQSYGDPGSWAILDRSAGYVFNVTVDGGVFSGFGANGYGGSVSGVSSWLHQSTVNGENWNADVFQVFGQQTPIYNASNQVSVLSVVSKDNNGTRWPLAVGVQGPATPAAVITTPSNGYPAGFLYADYSGHSGQYALKIGGGSYTSPGTLSIPGDIYAGGPGPYVFKGQMSVGSGAGNPPGGVTVNAVGGYVSSDTGFCIGANCVTSLTQGTVTSVGLTMPAIFSVSGSPVTSSGSAAAPTFRALVGADLPTPTASTLGGVESIAAAPHKFLTSISTSGVPAQGQPDWSDLTNVPSTFTPTPHNLLGSAHGDTTAASAALGDVIVGAGSPTATWQKLAGNTTVTAKFLKSLGSGSAATVPTWAQVDYGDLSSVPSSFTPSAHNLLSTYHGDTTTGTVARGDLITGQGASPTWARLAKGTAGQCLQMDGTATDIVWGSCGSGGGANLTLSNLTSPTAINLTTATFAGEAGITAGPGNHGVTLTPTGTGVVDLAGNLQVALTAAYANSTSTAQVLAGLSVLGTAGINDGDSNLWMTTSSGNSSFVVFATDSGGFGVYSVAGTATPFLMDPLSPDGALGIRPAGVSINTLAAASGNPLCYNATVDSGFNTISTCNATVLNNQANTYSTGKQTFAASAAGAASINLPSGTAPTTPAAGDQWYDGDRVYVKDAETNSGVVSSVPRRFEVPSDVSATSTTAATFATFAVAASKTYCVRCELYISSSSTSNTPKLQATCPSSPTYSLFGAQIPTSATAFSLGTAACGSSIGSNATATASTVFPGSFSGTIINGSNAGSLSLQVASSGSYTTTVKQGSFCTLY
jgi:hypothetical protein